MGTFFVIVLNRLGHDMVHVLFPKHDEVIQDLLLQRLNVSLYESVSVGRPERRLLLLCARLVEQRIG